jgi:ubiquitin-protein ligase E3 C
LQQQRQQQQVIPFHQRAAIFRRLMDSEKYKAHAAGAAIDIFGVGGAAGVRIRVRRPYLFEDSFLALNELGGRLRQRVQITFVNEHGVEEAGIDGGGVLKEFMDSLTKVT